MILRRLTEHVKAQNRFAVAIDFVIVVAGVFVGIQVLNGNAARSDRSEEQKLLMRLYAETGVLSGRLKAESDRILPFMDKLWSLRPALLAGAPRGPLSDYECWTLAASHAQRLKPSNRAWIPNSIPANTHKPPTLRRILVIISALCAAIILAACGEYRL